MKIEAKKLKTYWVAYYQPAGHPNWTKLYKTKKETEKYIVSQCCPSCKNDGMDSACASEWLVIRYDKYLKAHNHFQLMRAAGWKRIK